MPLYDCIIVGAGPAGASAAYHLSKQGHAVLLLEKAALPRYKPCGGGVSPQVAEWFDFDFSPVISQKVTRARYTWKLGEAIEVDLQAPIWMVRRNEFDYYLVQQAQRVGTVLKDETKATGVEFMVQRDGYWKVTTSEGAFEGRYLIAADGGRGPMAKWLGFGDRTPNIAGAIEIEPKRPVEDGHVVHFEFGLLKNGYVWNFPKKDGYSIGSGVFRTDRRKGKDLVAPMAEYAQGFGVDGNAEPKFGHPVYIWNGNQRLHTQNAVLAGEAACIVDPLTAEGIRPSIFTGIKAAEAVDGAIAGNPLALSNYTAIITTEIGSEMKLATRLAKAFYAAPYLSYRTIMQQPSATWAMARIFAGELKYADMVQKALRRLSGGLISQAIKP
ncbi:MAG: geranylgeranyl reductase family protein [Cyanobacteria bacterium P01_D01_bin.1]